MQNGTISELNADDKEPYSNRNDIQLQTVVIAKNVCTRDKPTKLPLLNFLVKLITERKSRRNNFTIARQTFV